jgi:hypothetical protein
LKQKPSFKFCSSYLLTIPNSKLKNSSGALLKLVISKSIIYFKIGHS